MFDDLQLLLDLPLSVCLLVCGEAWHLAHVLLYQTMKKKKKGGAIFQLNNCRRQVFTFVGQTQPSRKIGQGQHREEEQAQATNDDERWETVGGRVVDFGHSTAQQFASVSMFQRLSL